MKLDWMTAPTDRIWAVWTEDFGAVQIGTWADSVRHCRTGDEYVLLNGLTMQAAIAAAEARGREQGLRMAADALDKKHRGDLPEHIKSEDGEFVRGLILAPAPAEEGDT